jgi:hypothetical protein
MYKTLIITGILLLAISLLLGACGTSPTLAPIPALVPTTTSIYYDDGKLDSFASQGFGWGYSVSFSPPKVPFTIDKVKLVATLSGNNSAEDIALLEIWDENLDVIYSHELPAAEFSLEGGWITVEPNIKVTGNFRVVFYTKGNKSGGPFSGIAIGFDSSSKNEHSEIVRTGGLLAGWPPAMEKTKPQATTQWMIRVTGTY